MMRIVEGGEGRWFKDHSILRGRDEEWWCFEKIESNESIIHHHRTANTRHLRIRLILPTRENLRKMTVDGSTRIYFFACFCFRYLLDQHRSLSTTNDDQRPTSTHHFLNHTFTLCNHVLVAISYFVCSFRRCLQGSLLSCVPPFFGKAQPPGISWACEFGWQECVGPSRSQRSPGQGAYSSV